MKTRSILVGTAALLAASVAIPDTKILSPTAAYAQELSAAAQAALSDEASPESLDRAVLRERMKALRDAIKSGAVKGEQRKAAQAKMRAYREALKAGKQGQTAANEPADAEGESADASTGEDVGAKQGEQARPKSSEADESESAAMLGDKRPAAELDTDALRGRLKKLRQAVKSGELKGAERQAAADMLRADRAELRKRRDGKSGESEEAMTPDSEEPAKPRASSDADAPAQGGQAVSSDDGSLRQRVEATRTELRAEDLPAERRRELRQRLAQDRKLLRQRVAARNEERSDDAEVAGDNVTVNDVTVIVEQQTPAERLNERQLNRRITALRTALKEERVDRQRAEVAERILIEDRRALAERLRRERDKRRVEIRRKRDNNELRVDFNVTVVPPPIIAAAEVDYEAIETQLVAPPRRPPARRYTYEQIIEDEEVREAMPGIDIDTLNFDFGSAEVRPEEIDKIDRVGEAIEKIVAVRPDEVFILEGHTDAVGTDQANLDLSRARAEAVKEALTEYFLIEPDNLRIVGLGERYLKIPTEEPEEENRRVTVRRITPLLTGEAG